MGASVVEADSGDEGLSCLLGGHFDVCVTDFNMPQMSGIDLINSYRYALDQQSISVRTEFVLASADVSLEARGAAQRAGVSAWLPKPLRKDDIVPIMLRARTKAGSHCQDSAESYEEALPRLQSRSSGQFDQQVLGDLELVNRQLVPMVVEKFMVAAKAQVASIQSHCRSGSLTEVADLAHALYGNAVSVGAMEFGRYAKILEQYADAERKDRALHIAEKLEALFEALQEEASEIVTRGVSHRSGVDHQAEV